MEVVGIYDGAVWPAPGLLDMRHDNLNAIVTSHEHAILGPAQLGDTHGKPYADRQKRKSKRESRHICQHAMPEIAGGVAVALIAGQIVGDLKLVNQLRRAALGHRRTRPRPKLEHAVLFFV